MATTKTTTTKKTTKPAARRTVKVTPKTAADTATEAADGTVAEMSETAGANEKRGDLRMRAYLTAVTERSGLKRRDAKKAIEAALAVLGEAVADIPDQIPDVEQVGKLPGGAGAGRAGDADRCQSWAAEHMACIAGQRQPRVGNNDTGNAVATEVDRALAKHT